MTALKASLGWRGSDALLRTHHTRTGPEEKRVPLASASSKGVDWARLAETPLPPSSAACSTATSCAPCPGRSPGSAAALHSPRARQRETSGFLIVTVSHSSHRGSGGAHTASTEISPSLTCGNHVQHGKQVLTSTTIICPNSCPRWRSAQACLCDSPCDAHSAIAPPKLFQKHEGATPDLVLLPRRSGCRSRFRLIDHERVSPRQIQLKAQPGWLCGEIGRASCRERG